MDEHTVLVVANDGLGHGDEVLRHRMIGAYFQTVLEGGFRPAAILFYTAGVKLAAAGSPCLAPLQALEAEGVRLIVCRTCLDHYGLLEQVAAGEVGNLLMVIEEQARAAKVITL